MWEVDRQTGAAKVLIPAPEGQADDIAIGPVGADGNVDDRGPACPISVVIGRVAVPRLGTVRPIMEAHSHWRAPCPPRCC